MKLERLGEDVLVAIEIVPFFEFENVVEDLSLSNFVEEKGMTVSLRFDNQGNYLFGTLVNDKSLEEDDCRQECVDLTLEQIQANTALKNIYDFAILVINSMNRKGQVIRTRMPKEIKDMIDKFYEGSLNLEGNPRGAGRQIAVFKDYVIKFPIDTGHDACGVMQNQNEERITEAIENDPDLIDAVPIINKVLYSYRNVNVYKKLNTDREFLKLKAGVKTEGGLIRHITLEYGWRLSCLFDYENLDEEDALRLENWGYDEDEKRFKCLDYGIGICEV